MDLTIKDYTIVNVIGKIRDLEEINYTLIDIENVLNSTTKYGNHNLYFI